MKKIILCVLLALPTFAFGQEDVESIRLNMLVSATIGLRVRESPSLGSRVLGTLPYGKAIGLQQKTKDRVTIDGISDYWYGGYVYLENYRGFGWVFGGYLSDRLEDDPLIGFWSVEGYSKCFLGI